MKISRIQCFIQIMVIKLKLGELLFESKKWQESFVIFLY